MTWTSRIALAVAVLAAAGCAAPEADVPLERAEIVEPPAGIDRPARAGDDTRIPDRDWRPTPPAPAVEPDPAPAPPETTTTTTPAPEPVPAPQPTPEPAQAAPLTGVSKVEATLAAHVPARWRDAIAYRIEIIGGNTSWAHGNGLLQYSDYHVHRAPDARHRFVVVHEFAHLIGFRSGGPSHSPHGWLDVYRGANPEEMWADCVATAWTGVRDPSAPWGACPAELVAWANDWVSARP